MGERIRVEGGWRSTTMDWSQLVVKDSGYFPPNLAIKFILSGQFSGKSDLIKISLQHKRKLLHCTTANLEFMSLGFEKNISSNTLI